MGIYILTSYLQLECTLHMKNLKKVQMINTTIYPSNKAVAKNGNSLQNNAVII